MDEGRRWVRGDDPLLSQPFEEELEGGDTAGVRFGSAGDTTMIPQVGEEIPKALSAYLLHRLGQADVPTEQAKVA